MIRHYISDSAFTINQKRQIQREFEMIKYERHELSEPFGDMPEDERNDMGNSMVEVDQINPIVRYEGRILDGWQRYNECLNNDLEPRFIDYDGDDPVGYVLALNMYRRHIEKGQRASIIVALNRWKPPEERMTQSEMADAIDSSERLIGMAERAEDEGYGPDIRSGETSLVGADREIRASRSSSNDEGWDTFEEPADENEDEEDEVVSLMSDNIAESTPDVRSRAEKLKSRIRELEYDLMERDHRIEELQNEVEFLRQDQSGDEGIHEQRFRGMQNQLRTYRASIKTLQERNAEQDAEIEQLAKRLSKYEKVA